MRARSGDVDGSRDQVWHGAADDVSSGSGGRMSNITSVVDGLLPSRIQQTSGRLFSESSIKPY
jgi:hypothetical protein